MKYLIICAFLMAPLTVKAIDSSYSSDIVRISLLSKLQGKNLPIPYLSRLSVEENPQTLTNASGFAVVSGLTTAISGYDSSVRYDISPFYELKSPRVKGALTMPFSSPGEYFTIGLDTGAAAQKMNVGEAIFFAYTNALSVNKNTFFNYSLGGWFGGKIRETPCYDSYDRAYSCKSLTAWSDYNPNYPTQYRYVSVRVTTFF
jgi:hypothetical protein